MLQPNFHLSIGVKSIDFYTRILNARVLHRDHSGYVNIDLFGSQITLKQNSNIDPVIPDFHFGVNLSLNAFNDISRSILEKGREFVSMMPEVWDAGTPLERKKMYLKCPTGYLVELKGYE